MTKLKKYFPAGFWVVGFQLVSAFIGMTTARNMGWYQTLEKSELTPPEIAFPIVWTSLYILLAVAAWMVWGEFKQRGINKAFILFWIQMLLNWAWSFVFFEFQMIELGFYWICALNLTMVAYISVQWRTNKNAALLVAPTVLWASFAAYLNYSIMVMN